MSWDQFFKKIATYIKEIAIELMSIGMSYDDYWHREYEIAEYFLESYKRRVKREIENENRMAHRIGLYVYEAYASIWSKTPRSYPKEPHEITFQDERQTPQEKAEADMKKYLFNKERERSGR